MHLVVRSAFDKNTIMCLANPTPVANDIWLRKRLRSYRIHLKGWTSASTASGKYSYYSYTLCHKCPALHTFYNRILSMTVDISLSSCSKLVSSKFNKLFTRHGALNRIYIHARTTIFPSRTSPKCIFFHSSYAKKENMLNLPFAFPGDNYREHLSHEDLLVVMTRR